MCYLLLWLHSDFVLFAKYLIIYIMFNGVFERKKCFKMLNIGLK